jgi:hypothetical protein
MVFGRQVITPVLIQLLLSASRLSVHREQAEIIQDCFSQTPNLEYSMVQHDHS